MAKTVTTTLAVTVTGDGFGPSANTPLYSASMQNATGGPPGQQALAMGNNTIAVPATAAGVVIVPPAGSAVALTLKGVNGDTGIALDPANPTHLRLTPGAVASFVLNAGGAVAVALLWE